MVRCLLLTAVLTGGLAGWQDRGAENARDEWQRVGDLAGAMKVDVGSSVADVGAGGGYLTTRLAALVGPQGRVYAVDIADDAVRKLRERVQRDHLKNVEVVHATADDLGLPKGALDAIVMVNAYHEVADPGVLLAKFHEALKRGGRVALCEPRPTASGQSRLEQVRHHVLSPELIAAELQQAGFQILSRDDAFTANPSGPSPTPYSLVVAVAP